MKAFNKTQDNHTLINNLDTIIKELQVPLVYGRLIENVTLSNVTPTSNKLEHLLDRSLQGWIIVRKNGFADIYEEFSDKRFLTLQTTGSVTVSIWVF